MATAERLEVIGNSTSALTTDDDVLDKFMLQAAARELSDNPHLNACLRAVVPLADHVEILKHHKTGQVYYYNLVTCKLVWLCPICAARISERRSQVILSALDKSTEMHLPDAFGGDVLVKVPRYGLSMATFTIGHKRHQRLSKSLEILRDSYHAVWSGRKAAQFNAAYGIVGSIRALEVTYSRDNGWHPHIHVLLIHTDQTAQETADEIYRALTPRWLAEVEKHGGYATAERGVNCVVGDRTLAQYINKSGQKIQRTRIKPHITTEVTKAPAKKAHADSLTIWELLAAYVTGDIAAGGLWIEAQSNLRGVKQLLTSRTLQSVLAIENGLDDEIAGQVEKQEADTLLASLTIDEWRVVCRLGLRGVLLKTARAKSPEMLRQWLDDVERMGRTGMVFPS